MPRNHKVVTKGKHEGRRYERLNVLAPLFLHGYSYRAIRTEVMQRLNLKTYSLETVKKDIDYLLKDWRDQRNESVESNIQLELTRIDNMVREAWEGWEKSKQDYVKKRSRQDGVPNPEAEGNGADNSGIVTIKVSQEGEEITCCGDTRYLETINHLLQERRKLLGLYAPEKREVSGGLTFADAMMQAAVTKANATHKKNNEDLGADGQPVDWSKI